MSIQQQQLQQLQLQRFYRITMSLKRPFVPKSDVKQRFTTTTTTGLELAMFVLNFVLRIYQLEGK